MFPWFRRGRRVTCRSGSAVVCTILSFMSDPQLLAQLLDQASTHFMGARAKS